MMSPACLCACLQDRNSFTLKLEDTENWLYEDGEDQPKQVYIDKLAELKVSGFYIPMGIYQSWRTLFQQGAVWDLLILR